ALSEGNTKLKYSPATDLVIYDSAVMTLSDADFEPIPDSSGNLIYTARKSFSQVTLYDVLEELFVTRAGFSGFTTNITDCGISRVDGSAGQPSVDAIAGAIGMFRPEFTVVDDTLVIRDTTAEVDSGDPSGIALDVSASFLTSIGWDRTFDRIDAVRMRYAASRREYDYSQTRQVSQT